MATIKHLRKGSKVDVTVHGNRTIKFFSKKKYGEKAKAVAQEFFDKKMLESVLDTVTDQIRIKAPRILFRDILEEYCIHHLQERTRAGNNKSYIKTLITHWGDREVYPNWTISRVEFRDWVWKANHGPIESPSGQTHYSAKSIDKLITYAVAAINRAIDREIISGPNPLSNIKNDDIEKLHRRRGTKKRKLIPDDDFWKFISQSWITEQFRDVVTVIWATGLRRGEVTTIRWDMIHENLIEFSADMVKEGYEKTVVIDEIGADIIEKLRNNPRHPSNHVFLNRIGEPLTGKTLNEWWRNFADRYAEEFGNEDFREYNPHDIRCAYRTRLDVRGVPMSVAKKQLGHHSDKISNHYNIVDLQRQLSVLGSSKVVPAEVSDYLRKAVESGVGIEDLQAALQKLHIESITSKSSKDEGGNDGDTQNDK